MIKNLLTIMIVLGTMQSFAQVERKKSDIAVSQMVNAVPYRLFPTQNIWTFIKLNTRNGQMWQVQFDVKESNRFVANLSLVPLVSQEEEQNDRFTLYSTQNIYTFILLDQVTGRTWQVQWSADPLNRIVLPIQ